MLVAPVRTWVLRSEGRTILVDTGVGNHRQRPGNPPFRMLSTENALMLPARFPGPGPLEVRADGVRYAVKAWAQFG